MQIFYLLSTMARSKKLMIVTALLLLLSGMVIKHAQCELFTALVHLEGLLNLEQELLSSLNSYIHAEKLR